MGFDISLWNYIDADKYAFAAKKLVGEWKRLNVTIGCSFVCDGSPAQVKATRKLVAAAKRAGMGMLIYDKRVFWKNYKNKGKEAYEKDVASALSDFGKYENVVGYILSDEPDKASLPFVGEALDVFKRLTDKVGFVNFSWCDARSAENGNRENYGEELAVFAKERLSLISNDRYSCMHARDYEEGFLETGVDKFFADLNFFKGVADRTGLAYWTSLLSVGHWMYRTPSEADIRWQLSVSFAHGAKGIQWFFLNQHRQADDYYEYPVDIYGNRTPLFGCLERQTRVFLDKVSKPLDGYAMKRVWHTGKAYGGTPLLKEGDGEVFVYSDHGQNGILSEFERAGKKAYLIVNNDQRYPEVFFIRFPGDASKNYHIWLDCGGTHIVWI